MLVCRDAALFCALQACQNVPHYNSTVLLSGLLYAEEEQATPKSNATHHGRLLEESVISDRYALFGILIRWRKLQ